MPPLLIYDGDCDFCTRWVNRIRQSTGDQVNYAPYQEAAPEYLQVSVEAFSQAVHWVESEDRIYRGAQAALRLLSFTGPMGRLGWWAYQNLPGFASLSEFGYRQIAQRRICTSTFTRWLWGNTLTRPTYHISADLFLRAFGLVYLLSFLSLFVQIDGLIGSHGILPLPETMEAARKQVSFLDFPTLFWLNSSNLFLHIVCGAGVLLALVAIVRPASGPLWLTLWICALSLNTAGRTFLSFQWDTLLLEAGFLAIFLPPFTRWPGKPGSFVPPRLVTWLYRWLLFRLMFASGIVKLTSGDPTWHKLTALTYHYQTQPIPNALAWYMHHLPAQVHTASTIFMFLVEIAAPLFIFAPRRPRHLACGLLISLQLLIALTGNYTFFNLLSIALCFWLLEDISWPAFIRRTFYSNAPRQPSPTRRRLLLPVFAIILPISLFFFAAATFRLNIPWPAPLAKLYRTVSPFHIVGTYGLFQVMTTERPEIILEGSDDRITWKAYEFRYKPGDLSRRPPFVAPHQPRLDWQLWFAALGNARSNPWFLRLCERLLDGEPAVLALLAHNPFPDHPPTYLRARLYEYKFTTSEEKAQTGHWWKRTLTDEYLPVVHRSPIDN